MNDEKKPVDFLVIVPSAKEYTWRSAIRLVLWVLSPDEPFGKTFEVMSADTFVYDYGKMSVEEMDAALKLKCVGMVNSGDISKREWKAFEHLRQKLHDHWAAQKQAAEAGA